jgi:hypothetical protein
MVTSGKNIVIGSRAQIVRNGIYAKRALPGSFKHLRVVVRTLTKTLTWWAMVNRNAPEKQSPPTQSFHRNPGMMVGRTIPKMGAR